MADQGGDERGKANIGVLRAMLGFLRPYRAQVLGASVALVCTAAITLSIGQGLRMLVDSGFFYGGAFVPGYILSKALLKIGLRKGVLLQNFQQFFY